MNVLVKQAELRSEVAQLDVAINVAEKQLQEEFDRSIDYELRSRPQSKARTISTRPASKTLYFAFVPYDNHASATPAPRSTTVT